MSGEASISRAKWIGLWIVQLPVYLVTSYFIQTLIGSCYRLLLRAGANLPPNLLLEHFLWVSLISGILAGLAGLQLLRMTLLIAPPEAKAFRQSPRKRPQSWTWVLPTCWMAFGICAWFGGQATHSVLAGSSQPADLIAAFFGSSCYLHAGQISGFVEQACMKQVTFTHPWLGTLGYSLAAFVPAGWLTGRRNPADAVQEAPDSEQQKQVTLLL